jgi:hypothetical protein
MAPVVPMKNDAGAASELLKNCIRTFTYDSKCHTSPAKLHTMKMRLVETRASSPTVITSVPTAFRSNRDGNLCGNRPQSAQRPGRHPPRPITSDLDSTRPPEHGRRVHTGSSTVRLAVPLQFPGKFWQQTLPMSFQTARAMKLPGDMNRTVKRIFLVSVWPSLAHFGSLERGLPASTSSPPTARMVGRAERRPRRKTRLEPRNFGLFLGLIKD